MYDFCLITDNSSFQVCERSFEESSPTLLFSNLSSSPRRDGLLAWPLLRSPHTFPIGFKSVLCQGHLMTFTWVVWKSSFTKSDMFWIVVMLEYEVTTQTQFYCCFINDSFHLHKISKSRCTEASPRHHHHHHHVPLYGQSSLGLMSLLFFLQMCAVSLWPKSSSSISSDQKSLYWYEPSFYRMSRFIRQYISYLSEVHTFS